MLAAVSALAKTETDTIAPLYYHSLWQKDWEMHVTNPALQPLTTNLNYSEMGATLSLQQQNQPYFYQYGRGNNDVALDVRSQLHLSSSVMVWGKAAYKRGKTKDILYNSTSDVARLYPYVLGDTIGGSTKTEGYYFTGGTAFKKNKWTLGAQIDFQATQEYRQHDPRMRGIVTNLDLRLGASYALPTHHLAASVGAIFYKQTNDVDFYREGGTSSEYLYTGLGTYYVRFSGDNRSLYYKSTGLITALNLLPRHTKGFFLDANYQYVPYQQVLPKLNAYPLTTLYVSNAQLRLGWQQKNHNPWKAYLKMKYEQRQGDEHLAGDASGGEYKQLITLTMYKLQVADYQLGGMKQWTSNHSFTLNPRLGYRTYKETYAQTERKMSFNTLYAALDVQWQHAFNRRTFISCNLGGGYETKSKKNLTMPYLLLDNNMTEMVNHSYQQLTKDYININATAKLWVYPSSWRNLGWFCALEGLTVSGKNYHQNTLCAKVGIAF